MKGVDRCYEDHRCVGSPSLRPEYRLLLHWPFPLSRRRRYPRHHRVVSRPTGGPTGPTGLIRATGITRNRVPAGTTATRRPAGYPLSAGRRPRTGPHLLAGIRRPGGLPHRRGSGLVPDHLSTCFTRWAARRPRSRSPTTPGCGAGQQDRAREGHPTRLRTGDRQVHHRSGPARPALTAGRRPPGGSPPHRLEDLLALFANAMPLCRLDSTP
jgi:hypothetical protein